MGCSRPVIPLSLIATWFERRNRPIQPTGAPFRHDLAERLRDPGVHAMPVAQPLARYAAWRRAGDFMFLAGAIAVDPARNLSGKRHADIPPDGRQPLGESSEFSTDIKEGPNLAQSWFVPDRIRARLASAGGQMSDVIKRVKNFRNLDTSRSTATCASCSSRASCPPVRWWR
jgi:enamine deaminase RidA (YjgF/YER057c/UK114 family)